jgi:thioesterase domain-containing protein/acyl carrier protein
VHIAPATAPEALLCRLYAELTGAARVSANDSFFALGGHSLLAMRLIGAIRRETDLEVPLRAVFEQPTPQGLGSVLAACAKGTHQYSPLLALRTTGNQSPLFCVHPAGGMATVYRTLAIHLDSDMPVYGLQARGVELPEPGHTSIEEMAHCYIEALLKVQPQGPYRLLGWSFGGNVALEMTHQLESTGAEVEILVLLDTSLVSAGTVSAEMDEVQGILDMAKNLGIAIDGIPTDQAKQRVLGAMIGHGLLPAEADMLLLQRIVDDMQRSVRLMHRHEAKKINAPILYLRASDNLATRLDASLSSVTSGRVIIEHVLQTHFKMCTEESSPDLARQINGLVHLITSERVSV